MAKSKEKKSKKSNLSDNEDDSLDSRFSHFQSDPRFKPAHSQKNNEDTIVDPRFESLPDDIITSSRKGPQVDRYGRILESSNELGPAFSHPAMQKALKGEDVIESDSSADDLSDLDIDTQEEPEKLGDTLEDVPMGQASSRIAVLNLDWQNIRAVDIMVLLNSFLPSGGRILMVSIVPSEYGANKMKLEEEMGPVGLWKKGDENPEEDTKEEFDYDREFDPEKLREYELDRLKYFYAVVECDSVETASVLYDNADTIEWEHTSNVLDLRFIPDDTDVFSREPRDTCSRVPNSYKEPDYYTEALQHSKVNLTWDTTDPRRRALTSGKPLTIEEIDELDYTGLIAGGTDLSGVDTDAVNNREKRKKKYQQIFESLKNGDDNDMYNVDSDDEVIADEDIHMMMEVNSNVEKKIKQAVSTKKDQMNKESKSSKSSDSEDETIWEKKQKLEREKRRARKKKLKELKNQSKTEEENEEKDTFFQYSDGEEKSGKSNHHVKNGKRSLPQDSSKKRKRTRGGKSEATRAELELLMTEEGNDKNHFSMSKVQQLQGRNKTGKKTKTSLKKAKKLGEKDNFTIDTKDSRFSKIHEDPSFAIDPTDSRFKKTDAMEKFMDETRKHGKKIKAEQGKPIVKKQRDISSLLGSVKRNAARNNLLK